MPGLRPGAGPIPPSSCSGLARLARGAAGRPQGLRATPDPQARLGLVAPGPHRVGTGHLVERYPRSSGCRDSRREPAPTSGSRSIKSEKKISEKSLPRSLAGPPGRLLERSALGKRERAPGRGHRLGGSIVPEQSKEAPSGQEGPPVPPPSAEGGSLDQAGSLPVTPARARVVHGASGAPRGLAHPAEGEDGGQEGVSARLVSARARASADPPRFLTYRRGSRWRGWPSSGPGSPRRRSQT